MTKPDLKLIRERCEKATQGPWRNDNDNPVIHGAKGCGDVARVSEVFMDRNQRMKNAKFIQHSRSDIPLLLDYIEKLEKQLSFVKCCARSGESFTNEDLEKL